VRHAKERGNNFAASSGWPGLPDYYSIPITHTAESVWRAFLDDQLFPGAGASLFAINLKDEFALQDVEMLVVCGMKVLWWAQVSGSEDNNATFEFPLGVF
jgi:hypothetical protein